MDRLLRHSLAGHARRRRHQRCDHDAVHIA
jgi:hypothetical protein